MPDLWPRTRFWRVSLIAFWLLSAWAGAYSALADVEVCDKHTYTNEYECAVHNVAVAMFWYIGDFVDDWQASFVLLGTIAIIALTWAIWNAQAALTEITDEQKRLTAITQRAYLSVEPLGIRPRLQGDSLIGHVGIRNVGHLPAKTVRWFIDIDMSASGDKDDFAIGDPRGNLVTPPGTLMPRGTKPGPTIEALNRACGADAGKHRQNEETLFLYVWGRVDYTDGLGKPRFTRFCHRYNWSMRGQDGADNAYSIVKGNARYHDHGNGTDES